jgi:hypothetical protein
MSSIRKLKRYKFLQEKQKTSSKLSLREIVFCIGITAILAGIFYSIYNYCVYTSGRAEHAIETKGGTMMLPEEAPGNPGRRESTATGWKIAVIGIILIVISIGDKFVHSVIGKYHVSIGGKRHLRKVK